MFWVCFWMTVFWSSGPLCSSWTQVHNTDFKHTPLSSWAENISSWPHSGILSPFLYFQYMEQLTRAIYPSDCDRSCFASVGFVGRWELRHLDVFGLHGRSDETRASPELWRREGPACTALGQSGVRTRPFSPTLPVIDNRALFRMASVKVSCIRKRRKMQTERNTDREKMSPQI